MPSPRLPQAQLLLLCLCVHIQKVTPTYILCGISLCSGDRCCNGQCCFLFPADERSNWFGLAFIILGVMLGGACFITVCQCYKNCTALRREENGELAPPHATPTPRMDPPDPPQQPPDDPPPYSEVASKPFAYPLSVFPPPCYSNVIMADPTATVVNPQTAF